MYLYKEEITMTDKEFNILLESLEIDEEQLANISGGRVLAATKEADILAQLRIPTEALRQLPFEAVRPFINNGTLTKENLREILKKKV